MSFGTCPCRKLYCAVFLESILNVSWAQECLNPQNLSKQEHFWKCFVDGNTRNIFKIKYAISVDSTKRMHEPLPAYIKIWALSQYLNTQPRNWQLQLNKFLSCVEQQNSKKKGYSQSSPKMCRYFLLGVDVTRQDVQEMLSWSAGVHFDNMTRHTPATWWQKRAFWSQYECVIPKQVMGKGL